MSRILLPAAVLVALAVVAAVLLLDDGGPTSPSPGPSPLSGPLARDAGPPPLVGTAPGATDVRPLEASGRSAGSPGSDAAGTGGATAGALLEGTVSLSGGEPVAGLTLAMRLAPAGTQDRLDPAPEATTDASGQYRFELALDGEHDAQGIDVRPHHAVPRQQLALDLQLAPGRSLVHDLTVEPGVTLAGTLVDDEGQPVPGAEVLGWTGHRWQIDSLRLEQPDRLVRADGRGRFSLSGLGSPWLLEPRADGLTASARLHGTLEAGASLDGLTLELTPARWLSGLVLGAGARPLADAEVRASLRLAGAAATLTEHADTYRTGPRRRVQRSDADGRFRLGPLPGRGHHVEVEHAEHPPWEGRHAPADGELTIELEPGISLTGRVLAQDGRPLAGATLRLHSTRLLSQGGNKRSTTSDDGGRFVFTGLVADDDNWLLAHAPGHAVHVQQPLAVAAAGNAELRVVLPAARRLAGRVVDADGAPVAQAQVSIEGDRLIDHGNVTMAPAPTWERQIPGLVTTTTDAQGRFAFDDLYDGQFRVEASLEDSSLRDVLETRSGDERIELVLDPERVLGVTFTGTAVDLSTGLPVTEFDVTPMLPMESGGMAGTSERFRDEQGRWRLVGLDPGRIMLTAGAKGYAPWTGDLVDYLEGEHFVEIGFVPTRTVLFEVVDPSGTPTRARLTFRGEDDRQLMVETGAGSRASSLQSDDEGRARAAGLPALPIVVTVQRDYLSPSVERRVDLTLAPNGPVELVYEAPAEQELTVVVLTGSVADPASLSADDWSAVDAALQGLEAGQLRAPTGTVELTATDADGRVVSPQADAAPDPRLPAALVPHARRLQLVARDWTLDVRAGDGPAVRRVWSPAAGAGPEIIVVLLPEG